MHGNAHLLCSLDRVKAACGRDGADVREIMILVFHMYRNTYDLSPFVLVNVSS